MPVSLPALSRRHFLAVSVTSALLSGALRADEISLNENRFILMADTHIPASPEVEVRGVNMHDNFMAAAKRILALKHPPSAAMILGDCAYLDGKAEDYALLIKLLEPLRSAGLPIHLILGNHDHRERFWKALPADDMQDKTLAAKHVLRIKTPKANWFLLDSLDATNKTPGVLGDAQLKWLTAQLDEHANQPALICVHHQPDLKPMPGGLTDTQPLLDILLPRKQVKAMFFGHTHNWEAKEQEGLHLVNLPPVAYAFAADKPSGFVEALLGDDSLELTLHALKDHAQDGSKITLKWRS